MMEAVGIYLIPMTMALIGAAPRVFTKVFIRDSSVLSSASAPIDYVLVGQGVLICPLVTLVCISRGTMVGHPVNSAVVFGLACYLAAYLVGVVLYLSMSPDYFENTAGGLVRYPYKFIPFMLILVSVVVDCTRSAPS